MKNKQFFQNGQQKFRVKKTEGGLTNTNYLLDDQYLLRYAPVINNPFVQRENEIAIQKILDGQKINVPVVSYFYEDQKRFVYVTEYQKESINFASKELNETNLQRVAETINKLHQLSYADSEIKQLDMTKNLQKHIDVCKKEYGKNMEATNALMFAFLKDFDFSDLVVSHNDLMKENILIDNQDNYYIIDYEYCGLNVRFYDYAVFITSTNLCSKPHLHRYWLKLFGLTSVAEITMMHYFTLYRSLIGYYGANNMWETYQKQNYYDLMMLKGEQSQGLYREIKNLSHSD